MGKSSIVGTPGPMYNPPDMPKKKPDQYQEHFRVGADKIVVKGARTHNLKNFDVALPRNNMVAITGLSGSGKSSLAFQTIFAEGQRRYVESLSAYARPFYRREDYGASKKFIYQKERSHGCGLG
jgi:ABC-type molybdenum transport system ATPase subunit/photorepair protein PhrA